jgi:hypothetical protein
LADTKCDFGEIDKVMFEVVEWNWELNIRLLAIPKYDLCEVEKAKLLGVRNSMRKYVLFSAFWPPQNSTWLNSKKRCFKVSIGHAIPISTPWASKKRLGRSRGSDV